MRNRTFFQKKNHTILLLLKMLERSGDLGHRAMENRQSCCSKAWLQLSLVLASPASRGVRLATFKSLSVNGRFSTSWVGHIPFLLSLRGGE